MFLNKVWIQSEEIFFNEYIMRVVVKIHKYIINNKKNV